MTNHNHSADPALDGAIHTLQQLDGLGEASYLQNGSVLIGEAAARAAIADAVTNRIRLLREQAEYFRDLNGGRASTNSHRLDIEADHLTDYVLGGSGHAEA